MTDHDNSPRGAALQELEAALDRYRRTQGTSSARPGEAPIGARRPWRMPKMPGLSKLSLRWQRPSFAFQLPAPWFPRPSFSFRLRSRWVRGALIGAGSCALLLLVGSGVLWWRLANGPIMLDIATPWLTAAIEQNLGSQYSVQVGGTQLERDRQGRTALRLRDIVVRDATGAPVAAAPKAEVGVSGASLLMARPRAESIRLVDANMVINVDTDGRVSINLGGQKPLVSFAPGDVVPQPSAVARSDDRAGNPSLREVFERSAATNLAALVAWIDGMGGAGKAVASGFDGRDLNEIGIVNGSVTIDDRRNRHEWSMKNINLSLTRGPAGGVALSVSSDNQERPWLLNASLQPRPQGLRHLQIDARKVLLDDLLALRMSEFRVGSDTQVTANVESDIAADGTPQTTSGSIVIEGAGAGEASKGAFPIDRAEFGLDWDAARQTLRVPFKIDAGAARMTLRAEFRAPAAPGGTWVFGVGGGWIVLDPLSAVDEGLVLKRVIMRGRIDPDRQRVFFDQGDFGTKELGAKDAQDVTFAVSGNINYGSDPKIALGIAGNQMSVAALKRIWPTYMAPAVRDWVIAHITSGTVERLDVATNMPLASLLPTGPYLNDDSLSVEIVGSSVTLVPVAGLPAIRDADVVTRVSGRTATVTIAKGAVEVSPGRRLTISNGMFEVPDTRIASPPARVRFRMEGSVPAAAELLALDRLREFSGAPFDPATTRGNVNAQVQLALPLRTDLPKGSTAYNIGVDLTNFIAEKMLFGQRVEAQLLQVNANNQRYEIKGDVRIAGTPAQVEYRKLATDAEPEFKLQAVLDEAGRARLGLDFGNTVSGAFPVKLGGRVAANERDSKFNVEADLTNVKIDNLLPGWIKPQGRAARAAFVLSRDKSGMRFDDLLVDGPGVLAKGSVELDASGELQSANFPVFATSDGDKASVKADRNTDGTLRVAVRGDVYDGRNFVKAALAGPTDAKAKQRQGDLDLDIKLGVVAGHNGEALRGLDLRMSRRGGRIRSLALNAKIGRDASLLGDIRNRVANGRPVVYFETNDAGALFRFTDLYSRMIGGSIWVGMDPPTNDGSAQEGIINVKDFQIRGEAALDRVVATQQADGTRAAVDFSQARAEFVRIPGRMTIRDGVVRGPIIGATIEGHIDYVRDDVNMRGTLVPLYGLNNMFGQIPIVGLFLGGGSNEGLLGITYNVTGPTGNPRPMVNPLSAVAPGLLRKFFEFRGDTNTGTYVDPTMR